MTVLAAERNNQHETGHPDLSDDIRRGRGHFRMTYAARALSRTEKDGDCLIWKGAKQPNGYGQMWNGTRPEQVHRIVFKCLRGPIPDGCEIDHLCSRRDCINPDHLRAVDHRTNVLAGTAIMADNARKTHCLRGHALSGSNLRVAANGSRQCRTCDNIRAAAARARRRSCTT